MGGCRIISSDKSLFGVINHSLAPLCAEESRIGKILLKTEEKLREILENLRPYYKKLELLIPKFDDIREILGIQAYSWKGMKIEANRWVNSLKKMVSKIDDSVDLEAPIRLLNYQASESEILVLWIRLYGTHRDGLFEFLKDPRISRTNTELEREYSQELSFWRNLAGRGRVDYYVHVKGDYWLKTHRHYSPEIISEVFDHFNFEIIKIGREILADRRKEERSTWRKHERKQEGVQIMKKRIKETIKKSRLLSS